MNKFDINSMKFLSILIGICLVFILIIAHAYNYLPKNEDMLRIEEITPNKNYTETVHETYKKEESYSENYNKDKTSNNKMAKDKAAFETIDEEKLIANDGFVSEKESSIELMLEKTRSLKNENALEAISQYQNIIKLTDDNTIKSTCYEELALILAKQKRYGSALAAIQRGYNLAPSTSRELLLARLYYKTGEVDKATERINNILRRDFIEE